MKNKAQIQSYDVAYFNFSGTITESKKKSALDKFKGVTDPYADFMEFIEEVGQNKPKYILLNINSPGGTVGASEEIYNKLINVKKKHSIKIIVTMGDLCASGGLYMAMAADYIFAKRGTLTGSIGVIMQSFNFQGIAEKIGFQRTVIKSGKYKDILSPFREMNIEEQKLLQEMSDDVHMTFKVVVANGRKMELAEVEKFADGRIITGAQALKIGLVGCIGGYDKAIQYITHLEGREVVVKDLSEDEKRGLIKKIIGIVLTRRSSSLVGILESHIMMEQKLQGFLYLYKG